MSGDREAISGVVEGFYGKPWSVSERTALFEWMQACHLQTYLYAPKDDPKHRAFWRQKYSPQELAVLKTLAMQARKRDVNFFYGLSPGLDMRFSDPSELQCILERLEQMLEAGATGIALLFDDLPGDMAAVDQDRFGHLASAHASVTNAVYQWLQSRSSSCRLLFCPTPYCERMADSGLGGDSYLSILGRELNQEIDVFWTGPEIVSESLPVDHLEAVAKRLRRKPLIWDNLHANDYDVRRLYCGPYNRPSEVKPLVSGILLNPNNEFPVNYVAIKTLGKYMQSAEYCADTEYAAAVADWLRGYANWQSECEVALDDLKLLTDCYFLPHTSGPRATEMLACIGRLTSQPVESWGDDLAHFQKFHQSIVRLFEQFTRLADRELFYAWSRRIWELREELDLLHEYLQARVSGQAPDSAFVSNTHLPGTYRGGVVAQLQRLLVMEPKGLYSRAHSKL